MKATVVLILGLFSMGPVAARPSAAEHELFAITGILTGARALTGPKQRELLDKRVARVRTRLDVFPVRFGRSPRKTRGWRGVQRAARAVLARVKAPDEWREEELLTSAVLLDLVGRSRLARRRLDRAYQLIYDCDVDVVDAARAHGIEAGFRLRAGDVAGALEQLELALWEDSSDLSLFLCRRADLLRRLRKHASARAQFQRVLDALPASRGAKIARASLGRAARLRPSPRRLLRIYLSGSALSSDAMTQLIKLVPAVAPIARPEEPRRCKRKRPPRPVLRARLERAVRRHARQRQR